jgi:hypothetical protein
MIDELGGMACMKNKFRKYDIYDAGVSSGAETWIVSQTMLFNKSI